MSTRMRLLSISALFGFLPVLSPDAQSPEIDPPASEQWASLEACWQPDPAADTAAVTTVLQGKPDPKSAKACKVCHTAIYDEWKAPGQMHAEAWVDKLYQAKLAKKKRKKSCTACHIPAQVLARLPKRPKTRKDEKSFHEGVTCVSCHELDGAMHGPYGAATDAHKSVKSAYFGKQSDTLCNSCHTTKIDVVLPVGKDFIKAGLAAKGKSCIGCHMAEVERHCANDKDGKPVGKKRKGRSHKILGPNDPEFCASAFKVSVTKVGGKLNLSIANQAGHRVPGLKTREFHFVVRQLDAKGKVLAENKTTVNSEKGLLVDENRQTPFDLAAGAVASEVVIEHHFIGKKVADVAKIKSKL